MPAFPVHTIETAPAGSKEPLRELERKLGAVPNLAAAMSESPQLLRGFLALREIFDSGTFSPGEIQVLALTNAFENGCAYCMALHSSFARKAGVASEEIEALRSGDSPRDPKLGALSDFSRRLVLERGRIHERDLDAFLAAGYGRAQALEVVLGIALSILPNFAHHLTGCPIDDLFRATLWSDPRARAEPLGERLVGAE